VAKRKGKFGIRYSEEEKKAIVADWVAEQTAEPRRTQQQFAADKGITPLTLNKWVKASGQSGAIKSRRGRPAGAKSAKAVAVRKRGRPAGPARGDDSKKMKALLAELAQQTAVIARLRRQLHDLIDAM
jgi:transposase-like protein